MGIFCITAVRNEERYLPGFLYHIRDHVDGIIALDDCSTDGSFDILAQEPRVISILREERHGPPHANELENRYRLLVEAARLNARWLLCADADERFEESFLRRLPEEAEKGEHGGQHVRYVRIVNLWSARGLYRRDGICGPRWTSRMFKLPKDFTRRPFGLHQPWFPPELNSAPKAYMNAYLYHLKMIEQYDRAKRFKKFRSIDPNNTDQVIGYEHMIDETNLQLRRVLPWRRYIDLDEGKPWPQTGQMPSAGLGGMPRLPEEQEFDDFYYLNQNLDVQRGVLEGQFTSGWHHFRLHGASEGRFWRKKAKLIGFDFQAIISEWYNAKS